MFRGCPTSRISDRQFEIFEDWFALVNHRVLPDAGGWRDQAADFVRGVAVLDDELARYRAEERKKAEDRAKAQRKRKR